MAKYTSYHLMGGQIYYAKTGKAVPLKHADKLRVDIGKGTVYKDGRKVGQLKQKTITKNALATLKRNAKRTKRVGKVRGPGGGVGGGGGSEPKEKITREMQSAMNFRSACVELVTLKAITQNEYMDLVAEYVTADEVRRAELWAYVHSRFEEYGFEYETLGWS
jgi:hypothetical protein